MSSFASIPKRIAPRQHAAYKQRIPKIIWQTLKTNHVPAIIESFAGSWINNNPEYEYRFCDDADIVEFIEGNFPRYLDGYHKIRHGASKADLWRYLVIYKYGGVYADSDCRCITPLREWVNSESEFVTQLGVNNDICQWLMISVPNNPIMLRAAEMSLENLENDRSYAEHRGFELVGGRLQIRRGPSRVYTDKVLAMAGPPVLQAAAEVCFNNGSVRELLDATQVVCVSEKESCQMSGHVVHDYQNDDYLSALKELKTPHYMDVGPLVKILRRLRRALVRKAT